MSTKAKIIDGISFEISQPYAAGHTLTEVEAKVLNQVRSENIGNNLRAQVKDFKEKGKESELSALVKEYDEAYVFTTAGDGSGRKTLDPIEREARAIAKDVIKAELAKQGRNLKTVPEGLTAEQWAEKLEENIEKIATNETVLKAARKAVEDKRKRTESLAEGLNL